MWAISPETGLRLYGHRRRFEKGFYSLLCSNNARGYDTLMTRGERLWCKGFGLEAYRGTDEVVATIVNPVVQFLV